MTNLNFAIQKRDYFTPPSQRDSFIIQKRRMYQCFMIYLICILFEEMSKSTKSRLEKKNVVCVCEHYYCCCHITCYILMYLDIKTCYLFTTLDILIIIKISLIMLGCMNLKGIVQFTIWLQVHLRGMPKRRVICEQNLSIFDLNFMA